MMACVIEEMSHLAGCTIGIHLDGVWHLNTTCQGAPIGIQHDGRPKFVKRVSTLQDDKKDGIHRMESVMNVNCIDKVK